MLRDPEGPADHRRVRLGVRVRHLPDHPGGDARDLLTALECPILDASCVVLEPGGAGSDEATMMQVASDDLARHRVGEGYVRPDVEAEPQVAPLGGLCSPGIDDDQPHAVVDPLQYMVEADR